MVKKQRSRHRKTKKAKTSVEDPELLQAPHTFVFSHGKVGDKCKKIAIDMRQVMEPFTASNLKPRKINVLKDYVSLAGPLGVSHFLIFTKTSHDLHLKFARIPRGPTLHFKIKKFCLKKDVESSLKKPKLKQDQYAQAPLLILNGFQNALNPEANNSSENPYKLCATMLQNMFPSLNIHKVSLSGVKRCVLFNLNTDSGLIEFRHYNITVKPVGVSRRTKKLVSRLSVPNLSKLNDISDYLLEGGEGSASESELELDDPNNKVELPQNMKVSVKSSMNAVRLTELGPRLTLELYKIEDGLCSGEVLHHSYISKTKEEKQALRDMIRKKEKLKMKRKAIQEENVLRKKKKMELLKQKAK